MWILVLVLKTLFFNMWTNRWMREWVNFFTHGMSGHVSIFFVNITFKLSFLLKEPVACKILQLANFSICSLGRGSVALASLGCRVILHGLLLITVAYHFSLLQRRANSQVLQMSPPLCSLASYSLLGPMNTSFSCTCDKYSHISVKFSHQMIKCETFESGGIKVPI